MRSNNNDNTTLWSSPRATPTWRSGEVIMMILQPSGIKKSDSVLVF